MADIVIIGGSIMGSSIAYHLAAAGKAGDVCVIEPDPTYEFAAAPRSSGGVRLMHGLVENIEMSRYGQEFYRDFANRVDVDGEPGRFDFLDYGYLHLLRGGEDIAAAEQNCALQNAHGASNEMIDGDEVKRRFPSIRTDDIDAALHGPKDGFIDPHAAVVGFRRKARNLGVEYIQDRAVGFETDSKKIQRVVLDSGRKIDGKVFVNVAGAWGPELSASIGMKLPVEPLSRSTFYVETRAELEDMPLTKDPSHVSFRKEGAGFTIGLTDVDVPGGFDWEVKHHLFDDIMWPAVAHRVPKFESLKVMRSWSGHYAYNRMDGNTIIGDWPGGLGNYYFATGFSGAGLQKGPAIGRAMKELLLDGGYQTIDLSRLSYQRVLDDEPLLELGFSA
jgi:glycine/D-amino acid oxidase-like deaminating enzyme